MVVKLAGRDKIIVEAGNYERYVERFVAGFRHTGLHQQVQTHLLGGIVYTLVGTPFEECVDLGTFYAQHSAIVCQINHQSLMPERLLAFLHLYPTFLCLTTAHFSLFRQQ